MSRSNNPQAQFAARPLPGHLAAEQDAQSWNGATQQARPPHPAQQPAQGYAQPYAYQPEAPPAGHYAQTPPPDPFAGTAYAAQPPVQQARQAPAYAPPQHDPYGQPQAAQPQAYGGAPAYGGHPQWPAGTQTQDQGGYDLNGYGVGGGAPTLGNGYGQAPQHRGGQWGGADPYAAEPSFEPPMYAAQQQHGGTVEQTYAEEDAYEVEAPQGRGRKFAMVLLGAVIVGGGLTYAYSALLGPGTTDGTPPVVKGAEGPFKVKPFEPGGKQFAHTDSKIMGRLGEGGQAAPSGDVDSSGTRRVPVLTVGRDGSIQAPAPSEEPSTQRATVAVPGMTVIGGLGGPPPPRNETANAQPASEPKPEPVAAKVTTTAAESQQPVVVAPPAAPKKPETATASVEEPTSSSSRQSLGAAADATNSSAGETPKKAAAPKKTAAVAAPATAATAAQPAPTGAGWVAVLLSVPASDKSRMDALKQFADMQQKYAVLLQNKTPDIQEANLGEKGTYHRLMVGPPGSRESASELCTQLKAQGYPSCWVTAY